MAINMKKSIGMLRGDGCSERAGQAVYTSVGWDLWRRGGGGGYRGVGGSGGWGMGAIQLT